MMTNPEPTPITSNRIDTHRGDGSSRRETSVTLTVAHPPISGSASTVRSADLLTPDGYVAAMTASAYDVAAALRERLRDRIAYVSDRKLHALLFLAQTEHITVDNEPLFADACTATEQAVEVSIGAGPAGPLTEAEFAGVSSVARRYGGLSATDLEAMIRGQRPWQQARATPELRVDVEVVRAFARSLDDDPDATTGSVSRSWLAATREARRRTPAAIMTPDSHEQIAAFVTAYQQGENARS